MVSHYIYPGLHQAKKVISTVNKIEKIATIIFKHTGVSIEDMKSRIQKRYVVESRQIAMYMCTIYTNLTLKAIGNYMGGRDHSTVSYAKETVENLLFSDKYFKKKIDMFKRLIETEL